MSTDDIEPAIAITPCPIALDPFGFMIGTASRIPGLGGSTPSHDPTYVFHTQYVAAARGPATFEVQFDNLRARTGTLTLRVHMLPDEPGGIARLVNSARMQLNKLVQNRGRIMVPFEGFRGVTYGLMGVIADQSDIQADAVHVTLDRPANPGEAIQSFVDVRSTTFGNDRVLATARMISAEPPSMALPVSQPCTYAQFGEPAFAGWLAQLDLARETSLDRWALVYRLQVMRSYGMLEAGARGLAFGPQDTRLIDLLDGLGQTVVTAPPGAERTVVEMDPLYPPEDLVNYDFLWSFDPGASLRSVEELSRFTEHATGCLRPGGLAVHLIRTTPDPLAVIAEDGILAARTDLERLTLMLISRNNEVAQLKPIEVLNARPEGLCGIVVRKPRGVL